MPRPIRTIPLCTLLLSFVCVSALLGSQSAFATDDATRNRLAKKDCVRGKFKDYFRQGEGTPTALEFGADAIDVGQEGLPRDEQEGWHGAPSCSTAALSALLNCCGGSG